MKIDSDSEKLKLDRQFWFCGRNTGGNDAQMAFADLEEVIDIVNRSKMFEILNKVKTKIQGWKNYL